MSASPPRTATPPSASSPPATTLPTPAWSSASSAFSTTAILAESLPPVSLPAENPAASLRPRSARSDVADARLVDGLLRVQYHGDPEPVHRLLAALVSAGLRVQSFHEQPADLEDLFMRL